MRQQGHCSQCEKYTFCSYKGRKCIKCASRKGVCKICGRNKTFYGSQNFCCFCADKKLTWQHLEKLELKFVPKSEYNKYLFSLYLKYLRMFNPSGNILPQAKSYMSILETKEVPTFRSWDEIRAQSAAFMEQFGKIRNSGCPFIKTGRMLEELGVLTFKQLDQSTTINKLGALPEWQRKKIEPFFNFFNISKKSDATVATALGVLVAFTRWSTTHKSGDILSANKNDIYGYIDDLRVQNQSSSRIVQNFTYLNIFYKWCKRQKMILLNPCENIKINKPPPRLLICSEEQSKKIFKFIKNKNSNPEQAFTLLLILIWALKSEDLRYAKLERTEDGEFAIIFHRAELRNRKHYNREQVLTLPSQPKWFYDLQHRFYDHWCQQYNALTKSVPNHYLMLPNSRNVRPLTKSTILRRIFKATQAATGQNIPPRILRHTSGHLHTIQGDASMLSSLGWSKSYCFKYTWVPKITYYRKQRNQETNHESESKE